MSDMTQEDSVRRLAEIRERADLSIEWVYAKDDVPYLLSLIDSLTTERDNARTRCYHLEMSSDAFREGWKAAEEDVAKLQAEVKRLREALMRIDDLDQKDVDLAPSMARAALASTERSEATPPSEGGQSNG